MSAEEFAADLANRYFHQGKPKVTKEEILDRMDSIKPSGRKPSSK